MKLSLILTMERHEAAASYQRIHRDFLELCEMAAAGGLDEIRIGERHGMEFAISPNPFVLIAELAGRVSTASLGATVTAPFWHPLRLAGEAALADIVSGGRLELALDRGAFAFEHDRLAGGIDGWTAARRLEEMVPALARLWAGDHAHDGEGWSFPAATSVPKPVQKPRPPLWLVARDAGAEQFAVANGCNVQVPPFRLDEDPAEPAMRRFSEAYQASPGQPKPQIMLVRHTFVGANEAELGQAAEDLSRHAAASTAWFRNDRPVRNGMIAPLSYPENERAAEQFAPERMRRANVVGAPDTVVERLKRYAALGYDRFGLCLDAGMAQEKKVRSLRLFCEHVAPEFREREAA